MLPLLLLLLVVVVVVMVMMMLLFLAVMLLLAPIDCRERSSAAPVIDQIALQNVRAYVNRGVLLLLLLRLWCSSLLGILGVLLRMLLGVPLLPRLIFWIHNGLDRRQWQRWQQCNVFLQILKGKP